MAVAVCLSPPKGGVTVVVVVVGSCNGSSISNSGGCCWKVALGVTLGEGLIRIVHRCFLYGVGLFDRRPSLFDL